MRTQQVLCWQVNLVTLCKGVDGKEGSQIRRTLNDGCTKQLPKCPVGPNRHVPDEGKFEEKIPQDPKMVLGVEMQTIKSDKEPTTLSGKPRQSLQAPASHEDVPLDMGKMSMVPNR